MIARFPCKCDPIHVGHIIQLKRLLALYDTIILDILYYPTRVQNISEVMEILKTLLLPDEYCRLLIVTHTISYTKSIPDCIDCPVITGNPKVEEFLRKNGVEVIYINRFSDYTSSELRKRLSSEHSSCQVP
jgi:nicotinamide mononucleotide adenylyltransferase